MAIGKRQAIALTVPVARLEQAHQRTDEPDGDYARGWLAGESCGMAAALEALGFESLRESTDWHHYFYAARCWLSRIAYPDVDPNG